MTLVAILFRFFQTFRQLAMRFQFRELVLLLGLLLSGVSALAQTNGQDREFWNEIFKQGKDFRKAPSEFLVRVIEGRGPGSALDLGMGQGRNALYLAQHGWKVTGVDISEQGIEQARAEASRLGVRLQAVLEDLEKFNPGREQWDLVLLFYMHGYLSHSVRHWPQLLWEALKPGGLVVIEGFAGGTGGFQPNQLIGKFAQFRVRFYEDTIAESDWGGGPGKDPIIRMLAEKPKPTETREACK